MQLQCRDRNRIALQSDLLGAAALSIPNVLLLTGDHPRFGDHPDAKPVFDLDSIQLIWTARTMREQRKLLSGRELKPAPDWFIGAVENPFAPPLQVARRAARQEGRRRARSSSRPSSSTTSRSSPAGCSRCAISAWTGAASSWPASARSSRCAHSSTCAAKCPACTCRTTWCADCAACPDDRVAAEGLSCAPRSSCRSKTFPAWRACTSWPSAGRTPFPKSSNGPGSTPRRTPLEPVDAEQLEPMFIEIRASDDRLRGPKALDAAPILTSALKAATDSTADLTRLRVVCDWIQYRQNFRDPVAAAPRRAVGHRHPTSDATAHDESWEIAIDLRRAKPDERRRRDQDRRSTSATATTPAARRPRRLGRPAAAA